MRNVRLSAMLVVACVLMMALSAGAQQALQFTPVNPCRVVDTRNPNGPFGGPPIQGGTFRSFPLPEGSCLLPLGATAYSLNVTVAPIGHLGYLTIWPTGQQQPVVSTMNSPDGRVKANAAIVLSGNGGAAVSVYVSDTTNVIIDVNGYFTPVNGANLAFYPLPPCRVADTRGPNGPLGGPFLTAGMERDFPVLQSSCNIPTKASAYSFNMTAVPHGPLGYLTVWPTGFQQPVVSTLNAPTGTVVANAAIVRGGLGGRVAVFPSDNTDLIIDVNGYFASDDVGGLSLYGVTPCRVLDTRSGSGGNGPFQGELTVNVTGSSCSVPDTAQAFTFNATALPVTTLGYLTLWPDGEQQPDVSTLNAYDGAIASNMAIVPTSNGSIDAYTSDLSNLLLDISSYFAP